MHPIKALGPDGMPPLFYQKYWSVVGEFVMASVLNVLNTGQFPLKLNHTFITLVLKKSRVSSVVDL